MNLLNIYSRYPDQESCIEHLEDLRFGDHPYCPLCNSKNVARKCDGHRVGRWNCHQCKSSFNVLSGTIFEKTRVPLQKWFMAIGLMSNAKKSISSHQLARDLDITQPTALYVQARIRAEMASKQQEIMLQGIVEIDETFIGGKPRKSNNHDSDDQPSNKRGRGTKKQAVIGAVERGGDVVTAIPPDLSGRSIMHFVQDNVEADGSLLMTDEFKGYWPVHRKFAHSVINHSKEYVRGITHTNTIEGFWSLVKRAWYGTHHHYSLKYMMLYLSEAGWKYNNRKNEQSFNTFLRGCFA
ncbi:MAG: IS1595 family transposase [Gammaproteobacteria bacterium]|nr:IS1595 family transposase [Gammaproteobacteria bacterium]MYF03052.1 IS1595 family transposase [Gammaproteobacteria bacterium]MYI77205.1 IS1595 family transposase [Gammaproteobacteria bacterium]